MKHLRPLAVLLLAGLPACATAPAPGFSGASLSPGQSCRPAAYPQVLPGAAALVDSAALVRDLAALWRGAGAPAGDALVALRYDRAGVNVRRDVVRHRLPAAVADSLQKLVFVHRRTTQSARREWGVRLAVEPGEAPALRVVRGEVCEARPRSRMATETDDDPWSVRRSAAVPGLGEGGIVWIRVRLDARGYVTDARVERATAIRTPAIDTQLLAYARTIAFLPATEDGYPVAGEASITLRLAR